MENIIETIQLNNGNRLTILIDEDAENPRDWDNIGKLCLRKHRRYSLPNELDYEWDSASEDAEKLYDEYYIFDIDCYEHS
jgi:hypothetical protein